jgi:putative spermidine/putrescine transport system permease protein
VTQRPTSWSTRASPTLLLPLGIAFAVFFVAPLALLVVVSAYQSRDMTAFGFAQYVAFFAVAGNLSILLDTLLLGVEVTLLTLICGYPLAWLMTRVSPGVQTAIVFILMLPLLTSVVVRTFAWIVILGRQGIINTGLLELGLIDAPLRLLYSRPGVVVALTQVMMPMMVLPLSSVMQRIDPNLSQASLALGAGHWRTFLRITVPLSMPGMIAGCLLTFAGAVTAFITQALIGGGRLIYMPYLIYQQALVLQDWPFAAAVSIVFAITVLCVVYAINLLGRSARGYAAP